MIRQGKAQGWLRSSSEELEAWVKLNNVALHEARIAAVPGKGSALLATRALANSEHGAECLITIPASLILGIETIRQHSLVDRDFKEVLDSLGDFGKTARGAILTFLLVQLSTSWEDKHVGVHSPFTTYVKTLPAEALPTTWSEDELKLLAGTTLAPATAYKLRALQREFDQLCSNAVHTRWWSIVGQHVELEDWIAVDSMFRSRALDYPGIGHCMVPILDIANHEGGDATIAVYDLDKDGNAILALRNGMSLAQDQEITISYGDEKGACEMIFSYGFIDSNSSTAEALYLDLSPAPGDHFANEKRQFAECAPGVKLIDAGDDKIDWTGDFIWLLCLSPDDGLHFDLAQLTDGSTEVQAFWKDNELKEGAAGLRRLLANSDMWDVWRLRALAVLQSRVQQQLDRLVGMQEQIEAQEDHGNVAADRFALIMRLRLLEYEMLDRAYGDFAQQIQELSGSKVVVDYLAAQSSDSEDFA